MSLSASRIIDMHAYVDSCPNVSIRLNIQMTEDQSNRFPVVESGDVGER